MSNKVFSPDEEMDYDELKKYFESLNIEKMNYDDFVKYFEFSGFREENEELLPGKGRVVDVVATFIPLPDGKILGHEGVVEISLGNQKILFYDFNEDHQYDDIAEVSDNIIDTLISMYNSHSYRTSI